MSIQTYQCVSCQFKFEKIVRKMDENPVCPSCGQNTKQVWSTPAVAQWKCSRGSL